MEGEEQKLWDTWEMEEGKEQIRWETWDMKKGEEQENKVGQLGEEQEKVEK